MLPRAFFPRLLLALAPSCAAAAPAVALDTYGATHTSPNNGIGSNWSINPNFGNGAVVTWGFMLDGTTLDPANFPWHDGVTGTSNITALRNSVDTQHGAGAFNAAIQRAFDIWSAVANITFVGPITDSGLPVASANANTPRIRIGAFPAVPNSWFAGAGAAASGPPGPFNHDLYPFSGDVLFNLNGVPGMQRPLQIAPGTEDVTPVNRNPGEDLEGLFLHELGHAAIGLEHPRWAGENPDRRVMYSSDWITPGAPQCCSALNHQLHVDDIAGAQRVYGIRGDYNRDGKVDSADYVMWRKLQGAGSVTAGTLADGNVDTLINASDYTAWRTGFRNSVSAGFGEQQSLFSGGSLVVSEPTSLAWLAILLLTCSRVSPRRG